MADGYQIPPWIQPADPSAHYVRGMQIAAEQQRLMFDERSSERRDMLEQQRMMQEKAYNDAQIALRRSELDQQSKMNQIELDRSQRLFAAQKQFQDFVAGGGDPVEGILKYLPGQDTSLGSLGPLAREYSESKKVVPPPSVVEYPYQGQKYGFL